MIAFCIFVLHSHWRCIATFIDINDFLSCFTVSAVGVSWCLRNVPPIDCFRFTFIWQTYFAVHYGWCCQFIAFCIFILHGNWRCITSLIDIDDFLCRFAVSPVGVSWCLGNVPAWDYFGFTFIWQTYFAIQYCRGR